MNGERSKYVQVVQHVHKNISTYVPFLLMMKIDFTENFGFFFLSYFFRFIGVLILCGDFSFTEDQVIREKTLSKWLRNITSFKLVNLLGIGNLGYIIVSLAIFVLFCVRIFFYGITIHKIKEKKDIESIRPNKFQIFMDHIVFLLYPFLLEFLAFSIFILILPDKFVIKKTENMLLNIIVCILNVVLIIAYNVNGVIYMTCVNRPLTDKRTPVKYRYSDKKFYLIFLLQNLVILECLNLYLEGTSLKIYKIIMAIFLIGTFAGMYFTSLLSFNYPTILNNFVDIMAIFSFYSILIDAILYFLKYEITDHLTLAFFTIIKIILAVCFQYITNTINCSSEEIFNRKCQDLNTNTTLTVEDKDNIITNLMNDIINGNLNSLLDDIVEGDKDDLILAQDDISFQVTTTENQNINEYNNISTIHLGNCETILKNIYGIPFNVSLIILKVDYFMEEFKFPVIGYEVFDPINKTKLNLSYCDNETVNYNIPIDIKEEDLEK